jgi:hypothetical protein
MTAKHAGRPGGFFGTPWTPVFNQLVGEVGDPYDHGNDIAEKLRAEPPADDESEDDDDGEQD